MLQKSQPLKEIVLAGTPLCVYNVVNHLIKFDGLDLYLPRRLYKVTAILIMRRIREESDGFVVREELYPGDTGEIARRQLGRTRAAIKFRVSQELKSGNQRFRHIGDWKLWEYRWEGDSPEYRLAVNLKHTKIVVNPKVGEIDDDLLRQEFMEYCRLTSERKTNE